MDRHIELAQAAMEMRRWDLALESLGRALAEEPDSAFPYVLLAEVHYRTGDFVAATNSARQAISLAPQWGSGYYWLTFCLLADYTANGDRERLATEAADAAIEYNPNDPDFYFARANVALIFEHFEQALNFANEGLRLAPDDVNCLRVKALAENDLKRPLEAEQTILQILSIEPESSLAHEYLAKILLEQDRTIEAFEHVKTLLRTDPGDVAAIRLYWEVARKRHPISRLAEASNKLWYRYFYVLLPFGFAPFVALLAVDEPHPYVQPAFAIALPWLLLCCCYPLLATMAAEIAIHSSGLFNDVLPRRRKLSGAWLVALCAAGAATFLVLIGAATRSPHAVFIGVTTLVVGAISLLTTRVSDSRDMYVRLTALVIAAALQTIAFLWESNPVQAGELTLLTAIVWAMAAAVPVMIESRAK